MSEDNAANLEGTHCSGKQASVAKKSQVPAPILEPLATQEPCPAMAALCLQGAHTRAVVDSLRWPAAIGFVLAFSYSGPLLQGSPPSIA